MNLPIREGLDLTAHSPLSDDEDNITEESETDATSISILPVEEADEPFTNMPNKMKRLRPSLVYSRFEL